MSKVAHEGARRTAIKPIHGSEIEKAPRQSFTGLCQDCTLAEECTFPRDAVKPVRSCDEFMGVRPPKVKRLVPRYPKAAKPSTSPYAGLCRHCSRQSDCTFPKPAAGVWHCDEYA